jgi:hypothetical protein
MSYDSYKKTNKIEMKKLGTPADSNQAGIPIEINDKEV